MALYKSFIIIIIIGSSASSSARTSKSEQVEWNNKNQNVLNEVDGCLKRQLTTTQQPQLQQLANGSSSRSIYWFLDQEN